VDVLRQGQGLIGVSLVLLLAWGLSEDRKARPGWKWIGGAVLLQIGIALVATRVPLIWSIVGIANDGVSAIEKATLVGSSYMFGYTGGAPIPFVLKPGAQAPRHRSRQDSCVMPMTGHEPSCARRPNATRVRIVSSRR